MHQRSDRILEYIRGYLPRYARQRFREPGFARALTTLYVTIGLSFGVVAINVSEVGHLTTLLQFAIVVTLGGGFANGAARDWPKLREGKCNPSSVERISAARASAIYLLRMVPIMQAWTWIEPPMTFEHAIRMRLKSYL